MPKTLSPAMMKIRKVAAATLCALFLAPAGFPDDAPKMTDSVSVSYVLVPFTVLDGKGRPLRDLRERDVKLLVDGSAVRTDLFARANDAPVSFTILLDGSGSMDLAGKMAGARTAVRALIRSRIKGDDFALYVFSEGTVRDVVPFTTDGSQIIRAVDAVKPWGKTAFFDALAAMPDKTILGNNGSRAIILLTDGLDNASSISRQGLADILHGVDVPVYSLGLRSLGAPIRKSINPEELLDLQILDEIAEESGGRVAITTDPKLLEEAIAAMEAELRAQYLVGFSPTGRGDVKYRRITLQLARRHRVVRVRGGYRGTAPPPLASGRNGPNGKKGRTG